MKSILNTFVLIFAFSGVYSQTYRDSLSGFDELAATKIMVYKNLNAYESSIYLNREKRNYINKKYNLVSPSSGYSFKTPISNSVLSGNIDFESGNLSGWMVTKGTSTNSTTMGGCCPNAGGRALVKNGGLDPKTGQSLISPLGGNWVAKLNSDSLWGGYVTRLTNTIAVSPSTSLKLAYMCILNEASHNCADNPYFDIRLTDSSGTTTYFDHYVEAPESYCAGTNTLGFSYNASVPMYYTPWKTICVDLSPYAGSKVVVDVTAAECTQWGHWGYAYFDAGIITYTSSATNSVTINSNSYPLLSSVNAFSLCGTTTANISAPPGATSYSWAGPGITGTTTQSVSITSAGIYTLVFAKPTVCSNTTSITFSIGPNPTVSVSGPTVVCNQTSYTLTANGANNYTWYSTAWLNSFNGNPLPDWELGPANITYTVVGTNIYGCSNSSVYTVSISPSPSVSITGNFTICSGSSATLTGNGANTYSWSTGATSPSVVVTPTSLTTYSVIGTDGNGCKASVSQMVSPQTTSLSISQGPGFVCAGSTATLMVSGAVTYTWDSGANTNTIVVQPTVSTVYTVNANNPCGSLSKTYTLTVAPIPTLTVTGPSTPICAYTNFSMTASGANAYSWMPISTGGSLVVTSAPSTQIYTITGTGSNSCKNTTTLQVNILPSPTVVISGPSAICNGSSATLTATGADTYSWSAGQTTSSIVVSPTVNTSYFAIGTYTSNGCNRYSSNFFLSVQNPPTLTVTPTPNPTVCVNSAITLYANGSLATYTWSNGSNSWYTVFPTPSVSGTYTQSVSGTNACGSLTQNISIYVPPQPTVSISGPTVVCYNSPVTFTASGANTYNWTAPTSTTGTTATFTFISNPNVVVRGYDIYSCPSPTVTNTVSILPTPTINVSGPLNCCTNASVILTASGASTYTWSTGATTFSTFVSPTSPTVYTVTGTSTLGCTSNKTYTISYIYGPQYFTVTATPSVCVGDSVGLSGCCVNTYTWSDGGNYSFHYVHPSLGVNTYSVLGEGNNNCIYSGSVSVTGVASPTVAVSGNTIVCPGNSTTLTASGANTYTWNTGPNTSSISVTPTTTTTYSVSGKNSTGCKSPSVAITVSMAPVPIPTLTLSKDTLCSGSSITMSGTPSGGTFVGTFVTGSVFTPTINGNYILYYNYTNAYGCLGTDNKNAVVVVCTGINSLLSDLHLSVYPNPANNTLFVSNPDNKSIALSVFDLSGKLIIENKPSDNSTLSVDVKYLSTGMYFLKIEYESGYGHIKFLKN